MLRFSALALLAVSTLARADTIDDFVFTSPAFGLTYTFSLPASPTPTNPVSGPPGYVEVLGPLLTTTTPTGSFVRQTNYMLFYFEPFPENIDWVIAFNGNIGENAAFTGPQLFSYTNGLVTFSPGTYSVSFLSDLTDRNTLTITPEGTPTSPVPEPGTLALLATGTLGLLSAAGKWRLA